MGLLQTLWRVLRLHRVTSVEELKAVGVTEVPAAARAFINLQSFLPGKKPVPDAI